MSRLFAKLADIFAITGGVVLIAIVLVTTFNAGAFILDRVAALFGEDVAGLPGYEDFVRLAISAAALLFFPYCQLQRGNVSVDLFMTLAPETIQRAVDRLWLLVIIALAIFLAWWMTLGLLEKQADFAVTGVLAWAEWPFYLPGIAALILWALVAFSQLFNDTGPNY